MSASAVHVQALTPELAAGLAACHIACWREAYRGLVPDRVLNAFDAERLRVRWERTLSSPATTVVAVEAGEVVGFASCTPTDCGPTPLELTSLYLRTWLHGSGLADALLDEVAADAPCQLWVFEDNPRARAFYSRKAFRPDGTRKLEPFTGVPEIRMVRASVDRVHR